jgi:hypothetical protein
MTREAIGALRERMKRHGVLTLPQNNGIAEYDKDFAVVVLTAKELEELLDLAEKASGEGFPRA